MRKLIFPITLSLATTIFTGCMTLGTAASTAATKDLGGAALAGIAGGLIGGAIKDSTTSRAIGAASGVAIYGAYRAQQISQAEREKEAYIQGQRDARIETACEFWNETTGSDGQLMTPNPNVKEGVNLGATSPSDSNVAEDPNTIPEPRRQRKTT